MNFTKKKYQILSVCSALMLSACGGGGSSDENDQTSIATANLSPNAIAQTLSTNEDISLNITLDGTDSDGSIASFNVGTQPENGSVVQEGDSYVYTPNANFFGEDSFTFTAVDNNGAVSSSAIINITVQSVNDAAVVTLSNTTVMENSLLTGIIPQVTDAENNSVTLQLGTSLDSALFTLDATTNELSFIQAPDFETPNDSDQDNIYQVEVLANDGTIVSDGVIATVSVINELQTVITYPTKDANLGGFASVTTVSGNLIDAEDGVVSDSDLLSFSINGVEATVNSANSRFTAQVPVTTGDTNIVVKTTTDLELASQTLTNVIESPRIASPFAVEHDVSNNRLLILDVVIDALLAVDLTTKEVSVVSEKLTGTSFSDDSYYSFVINESYTTGYIVGSGDVNVRSVDLTSGVVQDISGLNLGSGENLEFPLDVALDEITNTLYVTDSRLSAIFKIDILTGNREIISDVSRGSGDNILRAEGIILCHEGLIAYVSDSAADAIFLVDLSSGDRFIVSDDFNGTGHVMTSPQGLKLSSDGKTLTVADDDGFVYNVEILTGDRTLIAGDGVGSGVAIEDASDLVVNEPNNEIYSLDRILKEVITINTITGERSLLLDNVPESEFIHLSSVLIDEVSERLYVGDRNSIYSVDMSDNNSYGAVSTITSPEVGSGDTFLSINNLMLDSKNNRLFIIDDRQSDDPIYTVDLDTGNRELFFSGEESSGFRLDKNDAELDLDNNRIIYIDSRNTGLYALDLTTRNLSILSDEIVGTGINFSFGSIFDFAVDIPNNIAYVSDWDLKSILKVNLTTGDRTILSDDIGETDSDFFIIDALVLDKENNRLLASSDNRGIIYSIDLTTGNREVFSINTDGLRMYSFDEMEYDAENKRLFVAERASRSVYVIDTETGERAIAFQ